MAISLLKDEPKPTDMCICGHRREIHCYSRGRGDGVECFVGKVTGNGCGCPEFVARTILEPATGVVLLPAVRAVLDARNAVVKVLEYRHLFSMSDVMTRNGVRFVASADICLVDRVRDGVLVARAI